MGGQWFDPSPGDFPLTGLSPKVHMMTFLSVLLLALMAGLLFCMGWSEYRTERKRFSERERGSV